MYSHRQRTRSCNQDYFLKCIGNRKLLNQPKLHLWSEVVIQCKVSTDSDRSNTSTSTWTALPLKVAGTVCLSPHCCDKYVPTSARSALVWDIHGPDRLTWILGHGWLCMIRFQLHALYVTVRHRRTHPDGTAGRERVTAELLGATQPDTTGQGPDWDRGLRVGCSSNK